MDEYEIDRYEIELKKKYFNLGGKAVSIVKRATLL